MSKTKAQSMTGFGKAELSVDGLELKIELRSVNSRYLDINTKCPVQYYPFENDIKNKLKNFFTRGRVDVFVLRNNMTDDSGEVLVNQALFAKYKDAISSLGKINDDNLIAQVLNRPDIIQYKLDSDLEKEKQALLDCLDRAAKALLSVRTQEAENLLSDLRLRSVKLSELRQSIEDLKKAVLDQMQERIKARIEELNKDVNIPAERLAQEVAILSERSDITEELVRITSHLKLLGQEFDSQASGKKIEFLLQELNREFNTISSKAQNADIQHSVVAAKLELEKMKEQSLNLA